MDFVFYLLTGALGGVLGGMGMGGGTILIPLLTFIFALGQHTSQALNLISFIPMAIIALIIHIKNKLIDFKSAWLIIVFGIISCLIGSYVAKLISGEILGRIFGGFLICLSVVQIILGLKQTNDK